MAQFLLEAMAIALSGGLVGLAVATLIVFGVDAIPTEGNEAMQYILNPRLSWPIALICVGILIGVGLLAGTLPARRAAAVDPVESLRYEGTSRAPRGSIARCPPRLLVARGLLEPAEPPAACLEREL